MSGLSTPPIVGSGGIVDGSVSNADVASDAAIAISKLAAPNFTTDVKLTTAGNGLYVKEGSNATMGTLTLDGASTVTVSTTKVTANSRIFRTVQEPGGTPSGCAYVHTRSAGVSFGVRGLALDTSVVAWMIVEPA